MVSQLANEYKPLSFSTRNKLPQRRPASDVTFSTGWFDLKQEAGLATFVYEKRSWAMANRSPKECEQLSDGCKIVNVYKASTKPLILTAILVFSHPCPYAGDFKCQNTGWGYNYHLENAWLTGHARTAFIFKKS